jgi:hypothetical protein
VLELFVTQRCAQCFHVSVSSNIHDLSDQSMTISESALRRLPPDVLAGEGSQVHGRILHGSPARRSLHLHSASSRLDTRRAAVQAALQSAQQPSADAGRFEEGRAVGRAEGEASGRAALIAWQLTLRFGPSAPASKAGSLQPRLPSWTRWESVC